MGKIDFNHMPGPGDEATWGRCTNHPNDPRTPELIPDPNELEDMVEKLSTDVDEIGMAFGPEAHHTQLEFDRFLMEAAGYMNDEDDAKLGKLFRDAAEDYLYEQAEIRLGQ